MINRRGILTGMGAVMAGSVWAQNGSHATWMLPEWVPHAACVMAWCEADDLFSRHELKRIRAEQVTIATAIASFEPVIMLVNNTPSAYPQLAGIKNLTLVQMAHYDTWTRDTLPIFSSAATGWNFNVWGEKFEGYEADRTLAKRFAEHSEAEFIEAAIVSEGGAMEADGQGNLLVTETCLLNPNRNPGMSRTEVEEALKTYAPAQNVIWLWGSEVDAVTDGHVDGFARFFSPEVVVVEVTDDKEDPEYHDLQENAVRMGAARNHRGDPFEVIRLNRPLWEHMPERGEDFAASYVNSYFPNGGIVMPQFGDKRRDRAARELFAELEPERRIVQIDIDQIAEGGGGIHCCTMQIPA